MTGEDIGNDARNAGVDEAGGTPLAATGIAGLDEILEGGFRRGAVHIVEGEAGTGKTTLALQFAREGAREGERVLYFSFAETEAELDDILRSHGWSDEGIDLRYLNIQNAITDGASQTMLHTGELYLPRITQIIQEAVSDVRPQRLIIDSLSDLRLVSQDIWLFRSQLVHLRDFLATEGRTTLLLDSMTEYSQHLRTLASGIVKLEQTADDFGPVRRRLNVVKMRAASYRTGQHDFRIARGGLRVYPRFAPASTDSVGTGPALSSGIENLDALLGGGIDRGTSLLLLGPAGVGKSLLATQFAVAAGDRGERTQIYLFDEGLGTFFRRALSLGLDVDGPVESEALRLCQIDPAEMTPGEFGARVREDIANERPSVVVIDSLSGYFNAMTDQRFLTLHLHELLAFLSRSGVVTILILTEQGPVGASATRPVDLSYLTDAILLLRYFEHAGEMRRALSVYKKRSGAHERLIREIKVEADGIHVGEPLRHFRGILTGFPHYVGEGLEESSP
jgi:circadian clock protein KaiC